MVKNKAMVVIDMNEHKIRLTAKRKKQNRQTIMTHASRSWHLAQLTHFRFWSRPLFEEAESTRTNMENILFFVFFFFYGTYLTFAVKIDTAALRSSIRTESLCAE